LQNAFNVLKIENVVLHCECLKTLNMQFNLSLTSHKKR